MKSRTNLLALCALLGLTASSTAFHVVPALPMVDAPDIVQHMRTWPTGVTASGIRRAVAGEFTGDRTPDVWQQLDDALVFYMDPSYMDYQYVHAISTTSIACLPGSTPSGKAQLIYADSSGLSLLEFNGDATEPFTTTQLDQPEWADARSLSCSDVDLDGDVDLLGIDAHQDHVLCLMGDGQGGFAPQSTISISIDGEALETFSLIYEYQESPQIAVLTTSSMFIMQLDGTVSRSFSGGPFGHIAKVGQIPYPGVGAHLPECVAWLHEVPEGGELELDFIDSRENLQSPVLLGTIEASAIYAGDVDGSGFDDVGLVTKNTREAYTLFNQRHFTSGGLTVDRFTASASGWQALYADIGLGSDNTSTPVLFDFDHNRKADLFAIDAEQPTALMLLSGLPAQPQHSEIVLMNAPDHPCFARGDFYANNIVEGCDIPVSGEGTFMLSLHNPWNIPIPADGWFLDLVLYRQDDGDDVIPEAVHHYVYDLSNRDYTDTPRPNSVWGFPIGIDDSGSTFTQRYYAVVKPIPPTSTEDVDATEYVVGLASTVRDVSTEEGSTFGETSPMWYLVNLEGSWGGTLSHHLFDQDQVCTLTGPPSTQRSYTTGGTVPLVRMPRFQSGTPTPGESTNHPPMIYYVPPPDP